VSATKNPQVALYTIAPPSNATVLVQFGPDRRYGLTTWIRPTAAAGGPVSVFVAGMLANTLYHMRAIVQFSDGTQFVDADKIFVTGNVPATLPLPTVTATTSAGMTPQGGVELLDLLTLGTPNVLNVLVTDLSGNVVWTYDPGVPQSMANTIKLMSNGNFLINFSDGTPDGLNSFIQEVDLSGNVIWQMTAADLNRALASATCAGCNITVFGTHHDFALLPNGHIVIIAAQQKVLSGLAGFPAPVTVMGDVLIDLDQNRKPVWLWSSFDHLDPNRHPLDLPDWTHTNSIVYSPDDRALIVSMRNQNWVLKIDYADGQGTGKVLWRLGYQGDFALLGGTDPVDWFSVQHDANVVSQNSSGTFQLMLFDDGGDRVMDSSGTTCPNIAPCTSRVPIFQLDEPAKIATIQWVDNLAPTFTSFAGAARLLPNGHVLFDEATYGTIYEVTKTTPPQTVWQMQVPSQIIYRGIRVPSLYPGIQW